MFIYELYLIFTKFLAFPIDVSTEIFFEEQPFPVVTVCNANPYKLSVIQSDSKLGKIKTLLQSYKAAVAKTLPSSDPGNYGLYEKMVLPYQLDQRARDALALEVAQLDQNILRPALYTFEELITKCTFSGRTCSRADFTEIVDPIYGACYSFNENSSLSYSTNRAGMKFGLKLLITVSQETTGLITDFLPTTGVAGARIAIHPRGSNPSMDNLGINVGVGYQTAIALTSTKYKRMKRPYGRCVDKESDATNFYTRIFQSSFQDKTYSLDTCFFGCRQRDTVAKCGCANPRYRKTSSLTYCEPTKTNLDCLQNLRGDQASTTSPNICPLTECSCDPPCSEITYSTTASIAKFPAANYYVATDNVRGVGGSCDDLNKNFAGDVQNCRLWYENNGLLLQVFFETLKYESYTEGASYGISGALNDLGGHAGLWLGLSVISIVEVCGLIALLVMYCVTCGGIKIRPDEGDIAADHRIQDIEEVKKELDIADKHDKDLELSEDEDLKSPRKDEDAKQK
ncbi:unnamed protein product [Cylicocyclus nassatus]|uniref:Uncharacterized protein n=1 Tax=Cylicocyclus nassatus TaxID=53992 RepID=A0AA36M150_CYLNA|nr:unnamed protein product [Cylicocyclus nassatus]